MLCSGSRLKIHFLKCSQYFKNLLIGVLCITRETYCFHVCMASKSDTTEIWHEALDRFLFVNIYNTHNLIISKGQNNNTI